MNTLLSNFFSICDAPRAWGVYFQDSASPQMEALVELHDNIMFYLVIVLFGVSWILVSIIRNYVSSRSPISNKYLNHGTLIELIWTITPALILILIAFPSFKLLYLMDEVTDPSLTVFVEGHQWYWGYQWTDFLNEDGEELEFDSYLVPESDNLPENLFTQESLPSLRSLGLLPEVRESSSMNTEPLLSDWIENKSKEVFAERISLAAPGSDLSQPFYVSASLDSLGITESSSKGILIKNVAKEFISSGNSLAPYSLRKFCSSIAHNHGNFREYIVYSQSAAPVTISNHFVDLLRSKGL